MSDAQPTAAVVPPALIMLWPTLTDTDGESIETTWEQWFKTFDNPTRFSGELQHAGWSACHCEPPRRKADNVVGLSAIVLDYDSGSTSLDEAAELWGDHYGAIHTTRSHTVDAPRFRVVLPLSRVITPDQFVVIWRWASKIATGAGHRIDVKTKDPARLWYRPGLTDGYETRRLEGTPLDPDPILTSHAYEQNEKQRSSTDRAAPADVLERRAVKYLAKLPASVSGQGGHAALWTAALSTVRGFRIPPDRALSMLRSDFNPRCVPPWSEKELRHKVTDAENDATTPYGYLADRVRDASSPAAPAPHPAAPPPAPSVSDSWRAQLSTNAKNDIINSFDNVCRILENHDLYGERLAFDEMRITPLLDGRPVNDADVGRMRREIEQRFGIQPAESNVRAAVGTVADARRFHPVRRYLSGLVWDGVQRINCVVPDVLHAVNTPLHQSIVAKWFVSAVARAINPGCKVDSILVLVGEQGARKSTFFATLGGEWFSDTHMDIADKDGLLQLHAAWIYEWAEIESITTQRQASMVKAFASSRIDSFRAPFGRTTESHPRSNVIVGSTNADQFLADPTGSRRFHVVRVGRRIDIAKLAEWRDQLWAEAVALHAGGATSYLTDAEDTARATANEEYELEDAWESLVSDWLGSLSPSTAITTARVLTDGVKMLPGQITRGAETRVASIMRRLGYASRRQRCDKSIMRVWSNVV